MKSLKRNLLASCALGAEQTDAGVNEIASSCTEMSIATDVRAPAPLSPTSAPGSGSTSHRASPWGATPPTVVPLQPVGVPPLLAAALLGTSRSRIYRLLREGKLRAVKQGVATLVLTTSIHEYAANLPVATFGRRREEPAVA
jgi:excisionase family DNA binding protein